MKIKIVLTLLLGSAFLAMGQGAAPSTSVPPLPPGPLLKRTPDYSTWTVTFHGQPLVSAEPPATGTTGEGRNNEKEPVAKVSSVVKTSSTIVEQTVDANGQRRQMWHFSGVRIIPAPGVTTPIISSDYGGDDIFSINFALSDFAGLDWVSKSTYAGVAKYQGSDCIVFKGTVSPLSVRAQMDERHDIEQAKAFAQPHPDYAKVPAVAYIDLETRLPLMVTFGHEKRIYQYGPPPQVPLQLPTEMAGPLKEYQEKIKRLSAPASRAF